jgi:hypothetical protein
MRSFTTDCPDSSPRPLGAPGVRLRFAQTARNARLRELGFCESAEIRKVADGGAMICMLMGTRGDWARIGVARACRALA